MAYLFKEKFNLLDLVAIQDRPLKLVLIAEPEEYLLSLYSHYLKQHNFNVAHCRQVDSLHNCLTQYRPDLVILNTNLFKDLDLLVSLFGDLKKKFSDMPVVTVGHSMSGQELSRLMSIGICGHIDRKFTRPKDVVHVVKAILEN